MTAALATVATTPARLPPSRRRPALDWLRRRFFNGTHNVLFTLLALWLLWQTVPPLLSWALLDSVWLATGPETCRQAAGACWAVIAEKHRVILFGTFPFDEQWRGWLVILLTVGAGLVSTMRRLWVGPILALWTIVVVAVLILMQGGVFGLAPVSTSRWGGLPLTLILFLGTIAGGLPLAILLALGRQSRLLAIHAGCVGYIEFVRGVPLVTVLFMASLVFPLFMPAGIAIDKLLRAQIAMMLFFAAYAAEVVRGGLQAIPKGQYEAAESLGLGYWRMTAFVVLPQALRVVIPPLMNDIIRAFKNTSLVLIIGLFDVVGATSAALADPQWVAYYVEAYLFVALLYFLFCFAMSKYSQAIERELSIRGGA